ncbi:MULTISPECIES: ferredoxin family protein [Bradyrhizobium]|uniref:Ferredoxin-like protein n=3 Tax=Bradyrhizobium TaxID=374 RepID=A0A410VI40_9BRAD|nr:MULTISPECIES: ferredoxin family protein [Bradyrhizobium]MCG2632621.1 ferredoxin family protein [Bradyrhizobium zhengyangense]MCG2645382.1 ferredoxin family protein [Bradyrhizobium zhengyangense]MCG2672854.1 ferredoxin family protein [Bradyrhizobium zhengyangense]MDN4985694.1 ferredoxin family protein [Bradyrhizobium sp. WYCCWR 13022]MDT4740895.1 ferredoxin family protein [Bradyrhizobium sp. WYCCWR 12699]
MSTDRSARVEDRLFYNRYLLDPGHPHIKVRPHTMPSSELVSMLTTCPAHCYVANDKHQIEVAVDGCIECGTCRVICEERGDIEWSYPRGGYGVLFKFG